jgi:hypothetical protein
MPSYPTSDELMEVSVFIRKKPSRPVQLSRHS